MKLLDDLRRKAGGAAEADGTVDREVIAEFAECGHIGPTLHAVVADHGKETNFAASRQGARGNDRLHGKGQVASDDFIQAPGPSAMADRLPLHAFPLHPFQHEDVCALTPPRSSTEIDLLGICSAPC